MVVALKPLHDLAPISGSSSPPTRRRRGAGQAAMDELYEQTRRLPGRPRARRPKRSPTASRSTASRRSTSSSTTAPRRRSGRWSSRRRRSCTRRTSPSPRPACACPCCGATPRRSTSSSPAPCRVAAARAALAAAPGVTRHGRPGGEAYPMPALLEGTDDMLRGPAPRRRERRARPRVLGRGGPAAQGRGAQRGADRRGPARPRPASAHERRRVADATAEGSQHAERPSWSSRTTRASRGSWSSS